MDVLSEVLKAVKLDGALFYNAEFSAPWCFRSPASRTMAPYLSPDAKHVIIYHLRLRTCRGRRPVASAERRGHHHLSARRSTHHEKWCARHAGGQRARAATNII